MSCACEGAYEHCVFLSLPVGARYPDRTHQRPKTAHSPEHRRYPWWPSKQQHAETFTHGAIFVVKRREAAQKDVRDNPHAPHVHLSAVRPTLQYFRRHVSWCAACCVEHGALGTKLVWGWKDLSGCIMIARTKFFRREGGWSQHCWSRHGYREEPPVRDLFCGIAW